jgi:ankyrin repeat protein/beta-lactamase regulating signal transducer with metallopeptidase domain
MNYISDLLSPELINAFGWTLLHSLWQGALIGIALALILMLMKRFTAQTRYYMILTAMLTLLALSIFTFIDLYQPQTDKGKPNQIFQPLPKENTGDNTLPTTISEQATAVSPAISLESLQHTFLIYFDRHMPSVVALWFLGMLIFLLKFLGGLAYSQRLKHYRTESIPESWQVKIDVLCKKLNIDQTITTLKSGVARVPMVIGYIKPVVLIPASLFTGLTPQQIESILAHELAHIARHDYLLNLIQSMIEILYFYHPAVWWISGSLRREREHCCDDIAVKLSGDSRIFARTLADLQERCLEKNTLSMALAGSRNKLFQRIHRLVNQPKMKSSFGEGFFTALVIIICLTAVAFSMKKSSQTTRPDAENIQSDSMVISDQQEATTQEFLDTPPSAAEERVAQPVEVYEEPVLNSAPMEEDQIVPDEPLEERSDSTTDMLRHMQSISRQLNEQEKEVYQNLLELKKEEKRLRSQNIDQMRKQMKALEHYDEVLREYAPYSQQGDNDLLLEGFSSPDLLETLGSPLPMTLPEASARWLVAGENKLITAVKSGNMDSVRACLPESDVNAHTVMGWTALMETAKMGNADMTRLLLEQGANMELRSHEGRTALWIAAYYGRSEVINVLLANGADINAKDNNGYTPLVATIENNQQGTADILLFNGADVNSITYQGEPALSIAIAKKSPIAYRLIENDAHINKTNNSGKSPLLIALANGWIDMASRLVEKGAYVNFISPEGNIPLLYAIKQRQVLLAKLLINHGADVNVKDNHGTTPLLMALDYKLYDLATTLLENGADVNVTDYEGNSPLLIAIERRLHTLAQQIIAHKADLNKKNVQGDSPLHYTLYFDMNEIALLLVQKDAALNVNNREGLSPLALAISEEKIELAHLMLAKGANPNIKDENEMPILLTALDNGLTETAKLLIDKGANINVVARDGLTPLLMAIDEHYVDICRLLIEKGADVNQKDRQNRSPLGLANENKLYEISALLKKKGAEQ